jgi:predicted amidohydrolase YtcJ
MDTTMTDMILTAGTIITMDPARPRAAAVAVSGGRIVAVGSVAECQAALPGVGVTDSGAGALLPGFIESHGHPMLSGIATMAPARSIAPWDAPTWADVLAEFQKGIAEVTPGSALFFNGFDALLHEIAAPNAASLDAIFGDVLAVVADNSGHGVYFTTAVIKHLGWDVNPPANPVGGSYGRLPDGSLDGTAQELSAVMSVAMPIMALLGGNPLHSAMEFFTLMSRAGITSASEMTYQSNLKQGYEAIAAMSNTPLRISLYHVTTADDCGDPFVSSVSDELLTKGGLKLWADGSPWIGNVAITFPYLDTAVTRRAGIDGKSAGTPALNYSREQLDAILDRYAPMGLQMSFHVNGDMGLDIVLDAYERALSRHGLLGTDHRWRVEHVGAGRADQFDRAAGLGVGISMGPFQFYYWGDLLDGEMFDTEFGSQWQAFRDAFNSGAVVSFHNDGAVSPPTPLLNIQAAVTRRTRSGALRGANQAVSLHEGLAAETINAARMLHRDGLVGSIEVGKLADFVELAADPFEVNPRTLAADAAVLGTWLGGARIDLDVFMGVSKTVDHSKHEGLRAHVGHAC